MRRYAWLGIASCCLLPLAGAAESATYLGRASCATSTCHGGVVDRGPTWSHSLSRWIAEDPHAGAGLLLRDADSRDIVLRLNADAAESKEIFDTVLRERCISCHATVTPEQCAQGGLLSDGVLVEGVSCEACHGAAQPWLEDHVKKSWADNPQRFAPGKGMINTETIIGRAESCVRCHVGSRTADGLTRDMNHDLIAAGHPALRFDLLLHSEQLPAHWDKAGKSGKKFNASPIRTRKIGRAISLAAAASLSAQRASDHLLNLPVPWPELADYDCFACHQSLSIREFKLPPSGKKKSPLHVSDGLPVWNTWHTIHQFEIRSNADLLKTLSPHRSDPAKISSGGNALAARERSRAAGLVSQDFVPLSTLDAIRVRLETAPPVDWHQAAIEYLEMDAAIRQMQQDPSSAAIGKQFRAGAVKAEGLLRFDRQRDPEQPSAYHSPFVFDPDEFRTLVLEFLPSKTQQ